MVHDKYMTCLCSYSAEMDFFMMRKILHFIIFISHNTVEQQNDASKQRIDVLKWIKTTLHPVQLKVYSATKIDLKQS